MKQPSPSPDESESGRLRPAFHRAVLKLSGEFLAGGGGREIFDRGVLRALAGQIASVMASGVKIAIVLGAGNVIRGGRNQYPEIPQTTADDMGMLGTLINALAFREYIVAQGVRATVLSAVDSPKVAERFTVRRARQLLDENHALVLAGGTGNPFFTTDTAAALRAAELGADVLLKGTNVDGVYSADPRENPNATRYLDLDYQRVLVENLKVMDASAVALCRDARIPIIVFNLKQPGQIALALEGKPVGTFVGSGS